VAMVTGLSTSAALLPSSFCEMASENSRALIAFTPVRLRESTISIATTYSSPNTSARRDHAPSARKPAQ